MIPAKEFNVNNSYDGKLSHDYIQLLPKFALQYDFDSRNNIYASVSKGYRSGGYNIQMFSDLLQNDMQASMMKDVAGVTIPALESAPIKDEQKQNIIGILNGMAQSPQTDVKAATLYKPEYSWNYEIGSHLTCSTESYKPTSQLSTWTLATSSCHACRKWIGTYHGKCRKEP